MTPPERLNAPPAAIHPSRRRAPARNAEVRANSDGDHDDARPKRQNRPELSHGTGVRGLESSLPDLAAHRWPSAAD